MFPPNVAVSFEYDCRIDSAILFVYVLIFYQVPQRKLEVCILAM